VSARLLVFLILANLELASAFTVTVRQFRLSLLSGVTFMQRKIITVIFLAFTMAVPAAWAVKPQQEALGQNSVPPGLQIDNGYDDASILVRYKANTRAADKASARALLRSSVLSSSKIVPGLERVGLGSGMSVEQAVKVLSKLPFVDYAHPNYQLHLDQVPDDEHYLEQWGLNNTGQASLYGGFLEGAPDADIDWLEARSLATGTGVVVAVLDTGVDYRHTDISPNVWLNEAELNGVAGIDDDGNGYIDDVRGWDFVNNDPFPLDGHGHGTMVAGIIAAVTDNTKGVAGIMPNGQVMALKVLSDAGIGLLSDAIEALEYAIDKGVRISNSSWGYSEILPEEVADHNALFDVMQAAQANDHLLIAAAGNDGVNTDQTPHYPSSFDLNNMISVGATNNLDELAWFSSYGSASVDIAAPGDGIISVSNLFAGFIEDYAWESGTSLAAPHVTGVAGLILEMQPELGYQQIKNRILSTARRVPGLAGTSATGGVLNMYAALDGLPLEVVGVDVLPGDSTNQVYPNKLGKLPVAVLSSAAFDAAQVDPATVKFGVGQAMIWGAPAIVDVDGQFGPDSTLEFAVEDSGILCNDTTVSMSGETYAGEQFVGTDVIDATSCQTGACHPY
jgi:subtilisin family serine protease